VLAALEEPSALDDPRSPFFIRIALVGNRQRFAYDLPAAGIIRLA